MTRRLLAWSTLPRSLRMRTRALLRSVSRSRRHLVTKLETLSDGFLLLSSEGIETAFAQDLSNEEKALLLAVQPQTAGSIFDAKPTTAAWHNKPSWYVVASNDNMIAPEQEKSMAKQINATTTTLPSSHAVMLSHPEEVAKVIADAAAGKK